MRTERDKMLAGGLYHPKLAAGRSSMPRAAAGCACVLTFYTWRLKPQQLG